MNFTSLNEHPHRRRLQSHQIWRYWLIPVGSYREKKRRKCRQRRHCVELHENGLSDDRKRLHHREIAGYGVDTAASSQLPTIIDYCIKVCKRVPLATSRIIRPMFNPISPTKSTSIQQKTSAPDRQLAREKRAKMSSPTALGRTSQERFKPGLRTFIALSGTISLTSAPYIRPTSL